MRDAPELVYEEIGIGKDGTPLYGLPNSTQPKDENATECPPLWQGMLAFIGTAIAIAIAYPGA